MRNQNKYFMVTWELDLTQFFVEADNETDAIEKAIKAHLAYDENISFRDADDLDDAVFISDMKDKTTYEVEPVDFDLLCEIIERKDCVGKFEEAVVFFGS